MHALCAHIITLCSKMAYGFLKASVYYIIVRYVLFSRSQSTKLEALRLV